MKPVEEINGRDQPPGAGLEEQVRDLVEENRRLRSANLELQAVAEELRRAERELQAAKEAAEAANEAKDQFLATLSHELRTPLTPVLAVVANLEEDQRVPPETRGDLSMIRRNVELEARLIDDLLDLTRVSSGKLELHRQVIDAQHTLVHAVNICCAQEVAA